MPKLANRLGTNPAPADADQPVIALVVEHVAGSNRLTAHPSKFSRGVPRFEADVLCRFEVRYAPKEVIFRTKSRQGNLLWRCVAYARLS